MCGSQAGLNGNTTYGALLAFRNRRAHNLCLAARFQLLLRIKRQLDHALEQLLRGNAGEVLQHQLLHVEPYQIAELQRAIFCCEYEVTMSVVDGSARKRRRSLTGIVLEAGETTTLNSGPA